MAWGLLPYVHDIVSNSGPLCRPRALCPVVLERRPWATMRVTYPVPSRNVSRSFVLLDASLMKVPLITWARKECHQTAEGSLEITCWAVRWIDCFPSESAATHCDWSVRSWWETWPPLGVICLQLLDQHIKVTNATWENCGFLDTTSESRPVHNSSSLDNS